MLTKDLHLSWAHPLVRDWFIAKFGSPTEPQIQGWPSILAGKATLISAPTGSGKTLAAFLGCLNHLIRKALSNELTSQIEVVYVSPLKALSNDVQKNLLIPLTEISALADARGIKMAEIQVAVRTGDTLARDRQKMLKKPPHILVTTPESLYILLTAEKSSAMLRQVKTVIVDEIHALADNKRGSHLALTLERLEANSQYLPVRIGLSATQHPIELVARFLTGNHRSLPSIINIGHARQLDVAIEVQDELSAVASNELWDKIYDKIAELTLQHRSTLVFVNTRRLAERVAHHLTERLGAEQVTAHHGSLSRKLRLDAETKLKNGELKVLVATASLELGIDIGTVDLVCQLGSPRAIKVALQRIGRAGHWRGAIPKGRIFPTTRDELLECAALVHAIHQGQLDKLIIPQQPLDILAQQIIAICATGDWHEDDLFQLIKKSFPYADLSRDIFDSLLEMLTEGIAGSRGRYSAYLFHDRIHGMVKARRGSRLIAIMNGGAIPENGLFTVIAEPQEVMVGTLDEDFAIESNRGDVILLGTTSWKINRIESAKARVWVEDAHGSPPSVPFWLGEAQGRTIELSLEVSLLRQKINELLISADDDPIQWLKENSGLSENGAQQIIDYILKGKSVLGDVPTQNTVIAERFFDEGGGMQLIVHAPFGARINKAWGLALRKRFCRSFNFELQAAATDDGINISLAEQHSFPLVDIFEFLHPNSVKEVLTQAVLQSPIFTTRWRWNATRSLALLRFRGGRKVPPNIQRMLSDDLLAAVFPDAAACQDNLQDGYIELPNHPLIDETMKEVLNEAVDVEGLINVLQGISNGSIKCLAVDTPLPSVFAHEILNANPYAFLDDAPLEERRARAVEMRRVLPESMQEVGKLDLQAITEVQQQAWPDIRNADELQDFLQTIIAFPVDFNQLPYLDHKFIWQKFMDELIVNNRTKEVTINNRQFWLSLDKAKLFNTIYPNIVLSHEFLQVEELPPEREDALVKMLRGWMFYLGPISSKELSETLEIIQTEIDQGLIKLETTGLILRGHFRNLYPQEIEWCERRLLARIHRLTLTTLRQEIEPVTVSQFVYWLLKWQHLAPHTQMQGEQGLLEIIKQLQGFELPANAWEKQIFSKRMIDYDAGLLDRLCFDGTIGWGRVSLNSKLIAENELLPDEDMNKPRRVNPTSVTPITFFVREDSAWMGNHQWVQEENLEELSNVAKNVYLYLQRRGASFFTDITIGVNALKSEVETALWELVAVGLITADGFDNLRAFIDPRRRIKSKRHRQNRRGQARFAMGRWSILYREEASSRQEQIEATAWMLLKRYGVVFRDLLIREKLLVQWYELLKVLRRLEARGDIRGGRFVNGFRGEQFALPYAVDSLRAIRKTKMEESITVSAVDPLNLVGIILPGAKISAISGKTAKLF